MDTELRQKWVVALRSGQYQQGRGKLKTHDNRYCCLGVLCDVSALGQWSDDFEYDFGEGKKPAAGSLGEDGKKLLGLTSGQQSDLVYMNDNVLCNFNMIADWIEENL